MTTVTTAAFVDEEEAIAWIDAIIALFVVALGIDSRETAD